MQLLRINENRGYFMKEGGGYEALDKLTKEDLLRLVEDTLTDPQASFDEFQADALQNQAHQIIYRSVYGKLSELADRREEFTDEAERLYLEEYDRYRAELSVSDSAAA
jgi:hypothetical protein